MSRAFMSMRLTRVATDQLTALCDFVAGSSLKQIAQRYGWSITMTEANIRRGFITYGFGPGLAERRPPRSRLERVVGRRRPRPAADDAKLSP